MPGKHCLLVYGEGIVRVSLHDDSENPTYLVQGQAQDWQSSQEISFTPIPITIIVIAVVATLPQRHITLCPTTRLLASILAPIRAGENEDHGRNGSKNLGPARLERV